MGFGTTFTIYAGLWTYNQWRVSQEKSEGFPVGKFSPPKSREGDPLPLVYGKVRVRGPVTFFWGNLGALQVYNGDGVQKAWAYSIDVAYGLCSPSGEGTATTGLHQIWVDDKVIWSGGLFADSTLATSTNMIYANLPKFFGGKLKGGSLEVNAWFRTGYDAAEAPSFMTLAYQNDTSLDDTLLPPHRGTCYAYLNMAIGESGNLPDVSFEVSNYSAALGFDPIGVDANPAQVLYDVLTNPWNRAGIPTADVDSASFNAAATTLDAESHGISLLINSTRDVRDVINTILDQIDAAMYWDPSDNLIKLKLIREDYTISALPLFDATNIVETPTPTISMWSNTINEVRVMFNDRAHNYVQRPSFLPNQANLARTGRQEVKEMNFEGVHTAALAAKIQAREMRQAALPFAKMNLVVNRDGNELRPGDPIRVTWPGYNMVESVFRVTQVSHGDIRDARIVVDLVQDQFAFANGIYETPPAQPGNNTPSPPMVLQEVIEAPRWINSRLYTNPERPYLYYMGSNPGSDTMTPMVKQPNDAGYEEEAETIRFTSTFTVETEYAFDTSEYDVTTGLRIEAVTDEARISGRVANELGIRQTGGPAEVLLIDADGNQEILFWESSTDLTGGKWKLNNVWRGGHDTVPRTWPVGTRGWVVSDLDLSGSFAYGNADTLKIKLLTHNAWNEASLEESPTMELTTNNRAARPHPVDNFKVGESSTTTSKTPTVTEDVQHAFFSRRKHDASSIYRGDDTDDKVTNTTLATVYDIDARIVSDGAYTPTVVWSELVANNSGDLGPTFGVPTLLSSAIGHGEAEIRVMAKHYLAQVLELEGQYSPFVKFHAHRTRQLLADPSFELAGVGTFTYWTAVTGDSGTGFNTFGDGGASIGGGGEFNGADADWAVEQVVDLTGWGGIEGLRVWLDWNAYSTSTASETHKITLTALDSSDVSQGTTNTGDIAPSVNYWTNQTTNYVLPVDTAKVKIRIDVNSSATHARTELDSMVMRLGQNDPNSDVANGTWDSGYTSWTSVSGGWGVNSTESLCGNGSLYQVGSSAELYQDVNLEAGYLQRTTLMLEGWYFRQTGSATTTITLEARTAADSVLASATTGALIPSASVWTKFELRVDVPDGTDCDKLRVRIEASDTGVRWDNFKSWSFKELHPVDQHDIIEFSGTPVQTFPSEPLVWEAFNSGTCPAPTGIWLMDDTTWPLLNSMEESVPTNLTEVGSSGTMLAQTCLGFKDAAGSYTSKKCIEVPIGGKYGAQFPNLTDLSVDGTNSFAVLIPFRLHGQGTTAPIAGSRDDTTKQGWEIRYSGTTNGRIRVFTTNSVGVAVTHNISGAVIDYSHGALHYVVYQYNATTGNVRAWTEHADGGNLVVPSGDVTNIVNARLGGTPDTSGQSVQIPYVVRWEGTNAEDLVKADTDDWWVHGGDVTGAVASYSAGGTVAASVATLSGDDLVGSFNDDQQATFRDSKLTNSYGLSLHDAIVNLGESDPNHSTWQSVGSPTVTKSFAVDANMMFRSVKVVGANTAFHTTPDITTTGGDHTVTVWARTGDGTSHNMRIRVTETDNTLLDSSDVLVDDFWTRIDVTLDSSTLVGSAIRVGFAGSDTGSSQTIEISWPVGIVRHAAGTGFAPMVVSPNGTITRAVCTLNTVYDSWFNDEGGIEVQGVLAEDTPGTREVLNAHNGTNDNDRRNLEIVSGKTTLDHYNATGSLLATGAGTTTNWNATEWLIRGRWNRAGILEDNVVTPTFIRTIDGNGGVGSRTAIYTVSATALDTTELSGATNPLDGLISVIRLTARELPEG